MPLMIGKAASLKAALSGISTTDGGRSFQIRMERGYRRNTCMLLLVESGSGTSAGDHGVQCRKQVQRITHSSTEREHDSRLR